MKTFSRYFVKELYSKTKGSINVSSKLSQCYNNRGVSILAYNGYGKRFGCYNRYFIFIYYRAQLFSTSIEYPVGHSGPGPEYFLLAGPTDNLFFNKFKYSLFHDDTNPLISNVMPQPSSYSLIRDVSASVKFIKSWYDFYFNNRSQYVLYDEILGNYYKIVYDENSDSYYTELPDENVGSLIYLKELYLHNPNSNTFKRFVLRNQVFYELDISENFSHNTTFFLAEHPNNPNMNYTVFYKLELSETTGEVKFILYRDESNMYGTLPRFISSSNYESEPLIYNLSQYEDNAVRSKFICYIGYQSSKMILPALAIEESVIFSRFMLQKNSFEGAKIDNERVLVRLYDNSFNLLFSERLIDIYDIEVNFEKYWLEIRRGAKEFSSIEYIRAEQIEMFRYDISKIDKVYIVIDFNLEGLDVVPLDFQLGNRGITYEMRESLEGYVEDDLSGYLEFRHPISITNIQSVGDSYIWFDIYTSASYSNVLKYSKYYGMGVVGFKWISGNTHNYYLFVDENVITDSDLFEELSFIKANNNIDIQIISIVNSNKERYKIRKFDTELVEEISEHYVEGEIQLLAWNLPVHYYETTSHPYNDFSYLKNIHSWVIKGIHSNFYQTRTTYFGLDNPSKTTVYTFYRTDEVCRSSFDRETLKPLQTYTGVTEEGLWTFQAKAFLDCDRTRTWSWEDKVWWTYLLPDRTVRVIPYNWDKWTYCTIRCGKYSTYSRNYYYVYYKNYFFFDYWHTYLWRNNEPFELQFNLGLHEYNLMAYKRSNINNRLMGDNTTSIPLDVEIFASYEVPEIIDDYKISDTELEQRYSKIYSFIFDPKIVRFGNTDYYYMYIRFKEKLKVENIEIGTQVIERDPRISEDISYLDLNKLIIIAFRVKYITIKGYNEDVYYDRLNDILYDNEFNIISGSDRDQWISYETIIYPFRSDIPTRLFIKLNNNGNCNFNEDGITDVVEFYKLNEFSVKPGVDLTEIFRNSGKWYNPVTNTEHSK